MFTGIITGIGRIAAVRDLGTSSDHGKRLTIETPAGYLDDVVLGDSIAIDGACMTVAALDQSLHSFGIDISRESLAKTAAIAPGGAINLEKALRVGDRLGGHLVSGHVDGVGTVAHLTPIGESFELRIRMPRELAKYLAYKGSVNAVQDTQDGATCSINLIPHTLQHTALSGLTEGAEINLEVDPIARYVERMMTAAAPALSATTPQNT